MVLKAENQDETRLDWLKWLVAVTLLLAGLIGNYYYSAVPMLYRSMAWLGVLAISAFVASRTQTGRWVVEFFIASRNELRKVVWPTREETMQTTLVVAVMVIILALILWCLDGGLVWLIGWLTGQRG
jgi:preprotein translocase subunit SecE